jgi:hypothetical protein
VQTKKGATYKIIPLIMFASIMVFSWIFVALIGNMTTPNDSLNSKIEFVAAYCITPVTVNNAGWQIALHIMNSSAVEAVLHDVFLQKSQIQEFSLNQGDSLSSQVSTGTSLSKDGLVIKPGETVAVYIWVGGSKFSTGTRVSVEIQDIFTPQFIRYVTLN